MRKILSSVLAAGVLVSLQACSSMPRRHVPQPPRTAPTAQPEAQPSPAPSPAGPAEVYGPPAPGAPEAPPAAYGPDPIQLRPIVLVLGPGMARGFAHAGVLRALHDEKIPIGAIIGTEMGALIGAIYAMDGNLNRFEWGLMHFKDEVFESKGGLLGRFLDAKNGEKLEAALTQVFASKDIAEAKVPFHVMLQPTGSREPAEIQSGPAVETLRAALAGEPYFTSSKWKGVLTVSAAKTRPLAIAEAKAMGLGPVIVVDAGGLSKNAPELAQADLVLRPDLTGISPKDFHKRTEAAFRGRKAVLDNRNEIRRWVGLSVP